MLCACNSQNQKEQDKTIHGWTQDYKPEDYFVDCKPLENAIGEQGGFNQTFYSADYRKSHDVNELEKTELIPDMENFFLRKCYTQYDEAGRFIFMILDWSNNEETISLVVSPYFPVDRVLIEEKNKSEPFDSSGKALSPVPTVTSRDDILVFAEGLKNEVKKITYRNDTVWYQLEGSRGIDYETMASFLDWFWEHPLDITVFDDN